MDEKMDKMTIESTFFQSILVHFTKTGVAKYFFRPIPVQWMTGKWKPINQ